MIEHILFFEKIFASPVLVANIYPAVRAPDCYLK